MKLTSLDWAVAAAVVVVLACVGWSYYKRDRPEE